jgi:hypothetical protein
MKRAIKTSIGRPFLRPVIIPLALVLLCFALSPVAQATPPPKPEDRGNGNSAAENVSALNPSTTGSDNTAHGWFSLFSNTSGSDNTADGFQALYRNTTGVANTATGFQALFSNTGNFNTATGYIALVSNTTGVANTATGTHALAFNTTGNENTATGDHALFNNTTGRFNTALGFSAGISVTTADNVICIGQSVFGANVSNTCFIGNIRGVTTVNDDAIPVVIDSAGQLGTISSSCRFKTEIKPMDKASEAILALKPVTFHYKSNVGGRPQFGLIAEEVAKVNPDLVVRDKNGDLYTVRYDQVNAMLLNEFIKEHRKVEQQGMALTEVKSNAAKQEATIALQQQEIKALTASLKEQSAQIQKVNAQIELSKPSPRTVLNGQ